MNDERLARRAAKGDRGAFEAIFRRYHQDLYRFCLATLGNPEDAQDALQNTMVKALRALPGEERRIKLKPWLYRVARNESVETLRRRRESAPLEAEQAASSVEIATTAEARARLRSLLADLGQLPERQRAALTMRELAGLGFEEIGDAFGTTASVARQTVYEARLSLRRMEAGREMSCETVMKELSDADGRVTRRREVRAHLRSCAACRAFRDGIETRHGELAAIAPLPLALSAGLLQGILAGGASAATGAGAAAAGGVAGAAAGGGPAAGGAAVGGAVATSAIVKSAATVAVVAAVGVGAADRGGLIEAPLLGGSEEATVPQRPPAAGATAPGAAGPATPRGHGIGAAGTGSKADKRHGKAGRAARKARRAAREARKREAREGRAAARERSQGYGSRGGKPAGTPAPATRGPERATERKAPRGNPSPGSGAAGKSAGAKRAPAAPAPRRAASPKKERPAAPRSSPPPAKGPPPEHSAKQAPDRS